ncbi:metallophosphoesterase family protein [Catellatospora chokoriensis]|uniref:Metallophosphoesterase n=1 Tax=Catellatospora chokoriensis TaxID=310353 RepID=A0A8J3NPW7_9ACTN|nr:metallophosphoesterase [Catellatospora chokoriensis]GIF87643.1 metallophosphoesterase [Catellatospora chokoriensis]
MTEPGQPAADDGPRLLAVSDLHVAAAENRVVVDALRPRHADDWLIVAGDVAETCSTFAQTMASLAERFARVVWAPGNHELWSHPSDPLKLRGEARYRHLVDVCRDLGVDTPEDPYPVWPGLGGPVAVAPLFVLYDYSFHAPGATTVEESLAIAYESGIVCSDEFLLHPDPFPSRQEWCWARLEYTASRLAAVDPKMKTVLVNHFPLVRQPTDILRHPEFAQWCGTVRTADWHTRFRAEAVVYGHLHIPRTSDYDGVRFEEVSLGYPREWRDRSVAFAPRVILPGRSR